MQKIGGRGNVKKRKTAKRGINRLTIFLFRGMKKEKREVSQNNHETRCREVLPTSIIIQTIFEGIVCFV